MDLCNHCGGRMLADGHGDVQCSACARRALHMTSGSESNGVITIDLQLTPGNLSELFTALALTTSKTAPEFLEGLGLAPADAKRMARGEVIHPAALVTICETYAITPTQVMGLMKRQPASPVRKRPGRKPRNRKED